ncbi:hypothetical protein ID866_7101 [Astraeus odoratus]|nr:hypothetical protein ID866_7101 [Astraeus odoratus]
MASSSRLPTSKPSSPVQRADSPRPRPNGSLIYEVFKPKLPRDPFARLHTAREPWVLHLDSVAIATSEPRRDVVLVLGAPTLKDITPVLQSAQLASSLIVLASHRPFPLPAGTLPAVCTICLNSPVTNEKNSALRLAATLQCAERVSYLWRTNGSGGCCEIKEAETNLDPSKIPANLFPMVDRGSAQTSPLSSTEGLKSTSSSVRSFFISSASSAALSPSSPPPDSSQRAFDALLNFIPDGICDVSAMKQTILLTSLSRPYLVPGSPVLSSRHPSRNSAAESRTSGIFRRKKISPSPLSSAPVVGSHSSLGDPSASVVPPKARIVHVLPPGRAYLAQEKLVRIMESYQLSFAYPPSLSMKRADSFERAIAFIVPAAALPEVIRYSPSQRVSPSHDPYSSSSSMSSSCIARQAVVAEWTVVNIILSGVLDTQANPDCTLYTGPRAWIGGSADFAFAPESDGENQGQSESGSSSSGRPVTPTSLSPSRYGQESRCDGNGMIWEADRFHASEEEMGGRGIAHPTEAYEPVSFSLAKGCQEQQRSVTFSPTVSCDSSISSKELEADEVRTPTTDQLDDDLDMAIAGERLQWRFWRSKGRVATQ